ncbi:MAG: OsmC family protein [Pseudomonadales bacterium]|nr:OsmC family protein [Pseudomonadales bacterium]MCP5331346.1 OsmC family protein [Pseudomonadales bacterium]MCP5344356.1 OsmC family protein [Pseudomonadales bacterium]
MDKNQFTLKLKRIENYLFQIDFGEFGNILADEPAPLGGGEGPSPSAMLAASVANCLSASLLYALARKKDDPGEMSAEVTGTVERVGRFLRVTRVRVALTLGVDKAALPSLENAVKVFEDYCTVTQSVRAGVAVDVEIRDNTGAIVHTSIDEAR